MIASTKKMESRKPFYLDTKGICFLCLRDIDFVNDCALNKSLNRDPFSLKSISRYLQLNLEKLLTNKKDLMVSLCQECLLITKRFSALYQTLELTKLRLTQCIVKIHDLIAEAETDCDRLDEAVERMTGFGPSHNADVSKHSHSSIMEKVRKEMITKCASKLKRATPRVQVERVEVKRKLENFSSRVQAEMPTLEQEPRNVYPESSDSDTDSEGNYPPQLSPKVSVSLSMDKCKNTAFLPHSPEARAVNKITTPGRTGSLNPSYFPCPYCNGGMTTSLSLTEHIVRFHCEQYFLDNRSPTVSSYEFAQIANHLLFKDQEDMVKNFDYGDTLWCPHCTKTLAYNPSRKETPVVLHMIKAHRSSLDNKLEEIQNDPDLRRKLDLAVSESGGVKCECGSYVSSKRKLRKHLVYYCRRNPVNGNSELEANAKDLNPRPVSAMLLLLNSEPSDNVYPDSSDDTDSEGNSYPPPPKVLVPLMDECKNTTFLQPPYSPKPEERAMNKITTPGTTGSLNPSHFPCPYCNGGMTTRLSLAEHIVRFHCEQYFLDNRSPTVSSYEFAQVANHLLFKDQEDMVKNFDYGDTLCCPHCTKTLAYNPSRRETTLVLHMIKAHRSLLDRKLEEIQSDPDFRRKLDLAVSESGGVKCVCGSYVSSKRKLKKHLAYYCRGNVVNGDSKMEGNAEDLNPRPVPVLFPLSNSEPLDNVESAGTEIMDQEKPCPWTTFERTESVMKHQQSSSPVSCLKCGKMLNPRLVNLHRKICRGLITPSSSLNGNAHMDQNSSNDDNHAVQKAQNVSQTNIAYNNDNASALSKRRCFNDDVIGNQEESDLPDKAKCMECGELVWSWNKTNHENRYCPALKSNTPSEMPTSPSLPMSSPDFVSVETLLPQNSRSSDSGTGIDYGYEAAEMELSPQTDPLDPLQDLSIASGEDNPTLMEESSSMCSYIKLE